MKPVAKVLFFAAAALWMASAQAELSTTWELPGELAKRQRECAALSNEVEMLTVRLAPGGDGMAVLYRSSKGGETMAKVFDEAAVFSKIGLVKSPAAGARVAANAPSVVVAQDDGWDEVYKEANTWLDCNGGQGFGPWTIYGEPAAAYSLDWVDGSAAGHENEGDFTLHSDGGETTVRRDFATPVAESGSFSVRAWVGAMKGLFCGFSVYDDNGELFRWGYGPAEESWGLVYAAGGSALYELIEENPSSPTYVDYTLAWERVGDDLLFNLTGESSTGYVYDDWFDSPVLVQNAGAVSGIAVIASSSAAGKPAEIAFDQLVVTSAAVPEPGTLGLLAAGLTILAARRKRG